MENTDPDSNAVDTNHTEARLPVPPPPPGEEQEQFCREAEHAVIYVS